MERAKELLADVARHRADLIRLQSDPDVKPERMKRCMRAVDEQVDECIDDVIERGQLDEYLRLSVTMSMGRVLNFSFRFCAMHL